jgi:hypothetical protein
MNNDSTRKRRVQKTLGERSGAPSGFRPSSIVISSPLQASQNSSVSGGTKSSQILPLLDARTKAYKGLEQLVLKNLVENMIPKDSVSFFGTGTAGDIWRSFLADQLATQVGKTVDLGIVHKPTAAPAAISP